MSARILIVDDDDFLLNALERGLKSKGYEIVKATKGSEAIELVALHKFDLVLLDVQMPRMNGLEVLGHIKEKKPNLPVIMISGAATDITVDRSLEKGAMDLLMKPFDWDKLIKKIEEDLELSRADRGRILVADDNDILAGGLKRYLEKEGYQVDLAADGKQALNNSLQNDYDLLIIDYAMPKMNGAQVTEELMKKKPQFPVILITGEADAKERQEARSVGVDLVLQKPFALEYLLRKVRWIIEVHKQVKPRIEALAQETSIWSLKGIKIKIKRFISNLKIKQVQLLRYTTLIVLTVIITLGFWQFFGWLEKSYHKFTENTSQKQASIMQMYQNIVDYLDRDEQRELAPKQQ